MEDFHYNLYSLRVSIIALVITILGLLAVYYQIKKVQESVWSNVHSTLCNQSFELIKMLQGRPELYNYFYYNEPLKINDPNQVQVLLIAEAFANFLEQLSLQEDSLPNDQWEVWKRYIEITFKTSRVVDDFIHDHQEWYSPKFVLLANKYRFKYNHPSKPPHSEHSGEDPASNSSILPIN